MLNKLRWVVIVIVAAFVLPSVTSLGQGIRNFNVVNRLRVEYDDNIFETESNKVDSVKIIDGLDLSYNVSRPQTFLSLRYKPSFIYWDAREDDTDWNHAADVVLNHAFTPRVSLSLKDTFRYTEQPTAITRGSVVRENDQFIFNSFNAALSYLFRPMTRAELAGRYVLLSYDDDAVAQRQDYDLYVGGLTIRHAYKPVTAFLGEFRYESLDYEADARDSETLYLGGGIEHSFSAIFLSSIRAGYQGREFDQAVKDKKESPYVDATLTYLPSPATRFTGGLSFSQYETDIFPYANQERTRVYLSLAKDVTAKIAGFLTGAYTNGDYDPSEAPQGDVVGSVLPIPGGSEETVLLSARLSYKINWNNFLELGYQYVDLNSDIRRDFSRNRVNLGWVWKL